jgi:hypothetical protein
MALIKPLATLREAEEGGHKAKGFVQMGIGTPPEGVLVNFVHFGA